MLPIELDSKLEERLAHLAKMTGRTEKIYAGMAIEQHLEDLKDY